MDIKSPEERSRNMAAIHSKNTKPEMWFRKQLFAQGYRYSLNTNKVPGHPDIYLRKYNTAIFVQFTGVFGIGIQDVNLPICQSQGQNSGRKSLRPMLRGIVRFGKSYIIEG